GENRVRFNYGWDSAEGTGDSFHTDAMFVYLDGTFTVLRNNSQLDDSSYQTFTSPVLAPGQHFIAVGVMNGGDGSVDSSAIFDNFSVGVPEPSTLALGSIALLGLYRPMRRQIKKWRGEEE